MKARLFVVVGIFCMAILTVSGQSTQGKPDKPDKPGDTEWIEFTGDLVGGQEVIGCCPNAGPNPPYRMCLNFDVDESIPFGTCHDGYLFINFFGAGKNRQYIVKFHFSYEGKDYSIKIVGGDIDFDRRTKVLTVTFTDELCEDNNTGAPIAVVNFTLVRYKI